MAEEIPLCERVCEACTSKGGTPAVLSPEECQQYKAQLCPSWEHMNTDKGDVLSRQFIAKNFQSAMDFLVEVGKLAENEGHHPDSSLQERVLRQRKAGQAMLLSGPNLGRAPPVLLT